MKRVLLHLALFFCFFSVSAQTDYNVANIPPELKENANAVIRFSKTDVVISSRRLMTITTLNAVTVFNEYGMRSIDAVENFNKTRKIKSIEATILNGSGKEIKKIKRKDFRESSVSEGSITDTRVLYMDYTPTEYPFTVLFTSELETSNTAFIPNWSPVTGSFSSTENSVINITCLPGLGFKYKDFNIENHSNITKIDKENGISFVAKNIPAVKPEDYSPSLRNFTPHVLFGLSTFNLEGVDGTATNWKDFGKWVQTSLLDGTDEISPETQQKIKTLVGNEKDPIKISKIIYEYIQNKTRYISIQLGIGGWKPMLAKDVDRLGYGDCKALSNYARALLKIVDVPSYYTIIYGDTQRRDLHQDFVSMQGNHVILAIPVNDKFYWLECTSQVNPFGFQGDFTDNRLALIIKPEGGEIVRTHEYSIAENTQISKGNYAIDEKGNIGGNITIKSRGTQYDNKFQNERKSTDELNKFYKNYFDHINNLKMKKISLSNNKEDIEFSEEIAIEALEYAKPSGNRLIFALNAYNPVSDVPQRYRNRTNPFEISRGFHDYDEITIDLPKGFTIEAKPENFELKDKFGHYKAEYAIVNENQLLYKRTFETNSGYFEKSEYENFRKFREQIARNDNAKIVLVKNQ